MSRAVYTKVDLATSMISTQEACMWSVCSWLEYAASAWDPHTVTHINQIERVQRRTARWVTPDFQGTSSVTTVLNNYVVEKLDANESRFQICAYV